MTQSFFSKFALIKFASGSSKKGSVPSRIEGTAWLKVHLVVPGQVFKINFWDLLKYNLVMMLFPADFLISWIFFLRSWFYWFPLSSCHLIFVPTNSKSIVFNHENNDNRDASERPWIIWSFGLVLMWNTVC